MNYQTNNMDLKPKIEIELHPVLEAYLRWIYKTPSEVKGISITRHHDIGKHISSHVLRSNMPVKNHKNEGLTTIFLPMTEGNEGIYQNYFFYVDEWGKEKINDFIYTDFSMWMKRRYETGYIYKWRQQDIIDAVINGLNIDDTKENVSFLRRFDYRNNRKTTEKRFLILVNN